MEPVMTIKDCRPRAPTRRGPEFQRTRPLRAAGLQQTAIYKMDCRPRDLTRRTDHSPAYRGTSFTLVELAVVLSMMILIMTLAVPYFKNLTGGSKLQAATRQVYEALNQARSNAITTRKRTRIFFPVATTGPAIYRTLMYKTNAMPPTTYPVGADDVPGDPAGIDTSYVIADCSYDPAGAGTDAPCGGGANTPWRWIARTPWQFLPKGTVFDHNNAVAGTNGLTGADCIQTIGGQTAFNAGRTGPAKFTVFYFLGANPANLGETISFCSGGIAINSDAAYIEFKPTGASSNNSVSLKIVEGFYPNASFNYKVTYTNVNVSSVPAACTSVFPCPKNYSLIVTDTLTGRLRILKPGGTDGGCGP